MAIELKVRTMIVWIVALLVLCTGASLARLVNKDALIEGLRERWKTHFLWRQDQVIAEADRRFPIRDRATARLASDLAKAGRAKAVADFTPEDHRMAMLQEIGDRAEDEAPQPWWVRGARRRNARPWSTVSDEIIRLRGYAEFISCPWCMPVYLFALVALWTWARVYGCDLGLTWAELNDAALPIDWLALTVPLSLRWIYGLVASHADS